MNISKDFKFFYLFIIVILLSLKSSEIYSENLYLVEFSPPNHENYTVEKELLIIEKSAELALYKGKTIFPKCNLSVHKNLIQGSEEELYKYLKSIGKDIKNNSIIVGLSRSTFAKIGAKALQGTGVKGISIGATSPDFNKINKKFYSIISTMKSELTAIHSFSKKVQCQSITGIFDTNDPLSNDYLNGFKHFWGENGKFIKVNFKNPNLTELNEKECIFVALNFSESNKILEYISTIQARYVFGTADWNIYSGEITSLLINFPKLFINKKIFVPTEWFSSMNKNSIQYQKLVDKDKLQPNPIGAYTYDSMLIAIESLCLNKEIEDVLKSGKVKRNFLRQYFSVSETHNIESQMYMILLGGNNN